MATKKAVKKTTKIARSAKTGEIVSKAFAKKHPSTTEVETVKRGKKTSYKIPKNLADCADLLFKTKNDRLAAERALEPLISFEKELKQHIIDNLPKSKIGGIAGKVVRVEIRKKEIPQVSDEKAFERFAHKKGNEDLLVMRPNHKAIEDRWEAGKKIPGVSVFTAVTLSVNKLK